jgi:hypothetical protein
MTFQPSFENGARLRLIEIIGVLLTVLKCRVRQNRHRPPHDKASWLSFDTALYPHDYRNYTEIPDEQKKLTKREKRKKYI